MLHAPLTFLRFSLGSNQIGDQGAAALGEGLKVNSTITTLEYVSLVSVVNDQLIPDLTVFHQTDSETAELPLSARDLRSTARSRR